MGGDRDLFGAPIPQRDTRRGRFVTDKNRGTGYTPEQRRAELDRWWEEHMQECFPQLAQDLINARGAAIAARSGMNVNDVGAEMQAMDSLKAVSDGLVATYGLAITGEELADKVLKEAKILEANSQIPHLAPRLASVVVAAFADIRGLTPRTTNALLARVSQRRLPEF